MMAGDWDFIVVSLSLSLIKTLDWIGLYQAMCGNESNHVKYEEKVVFSFFDM